MKISRSFLQVAVAAIFFTSVPLPGRAQETSIYSMDDVQPGLRGEGRTVFEGQKIETFSFEVVGVLRNVGPRRNLILARVEGPLLEKTGVYAGMSGSPLYVDGKFLGAVSSTWAFSKEALAGVTPAGEMMDLVGRPVTGALEDSKTAAIYTFEDFLDRKVFHVSGPLQTAAPQARPPLPMCFRGFHPKVVEAAAPFWSPLGLTPVQGIPGGASSEKKSELAPGSAVAVQLMRGDMEISVSGTLSLRQGNRVVAFGHSFFNLGPAAMPLAAARVEAIVPSGNLSFRLSSSLEEIGTMFRDGESGVMGVLGRRAPMVPVHVLLRRPDGVEERYEFEQVTNPLLAPGLLAAAVSNILVSAEKFVGPQTVEMEGGITLKDGEVIRIDDMLSGNTSTDSAAQLASAYLAFLYNNGVAAAEIQDISLCLQLDGRTRSAFLTSVQIPATKVKAGEKLTMLLEYRPYQKPAETVEVSLDVPVYLRGRKISLFVSDAGTLARLETPTGRYIPKDLSEIATILNRIRPSRNVYVHLAEWVPSSIVEGRVMGELPSDLRVLQRTPAHQRSTPTMPVTLLTSTVLPTPYQITGFLQVNLEVM